MKFDCSKCGKGVFYITDDGEGKLHIECANCRTECFKVDKYLCKPFIP